jgi:hypothetical protein
VGTGERRGDEIEREGENGEHREEAQLTRSTTVVSDRSAVAGIVGEDGGELRDAELDSDESRASGLDSFDEVAQHDDAELEACSGRSGEAWNGDEVWRPGARVRSLRGDRERERGRG